ncbi:MAG: Crp/Fnr family transcriptional regulator [Candidatus Latescibacteria bacterium]|jgi:CRP-like cAMP-binding protein|nr:Crp/Fnr family transcriptional regulator [Candidatus Latescibacterota bacterium]
MENGVRRSGTDRRKVQKEVVVERRQEKDRREVIKESLRIIGFMKKIPIFKGLIDDQYKKILSVCSKMPIQKDHFLCGEGDESKELFILIKGQLKVLFRGGTLVGYISPMGIVGEIGIFTDTKRSATVMASKDSTVLKVSKGEIFKLFKQDCVLGTRILLNVIKDLANKLQEDNEVIEELRNKRRTRVL